MTFIWFMMYSVVPSSVGWKPVVAEVLNLLLDLIDLPLSILLVKLTLCVLCMLCIAGWAAQIGRPMQYLPAAGSPLVPR